MARPERSARRQPGCHRWTRRKPRPAPQPQPTADGGGGAWSRHTCGVQQARPHRAAHSPRPAARARRPAPQASPDTGAQYGPGPCPPRDRREARPARPAGVVPSAAPPRPFPQRLRLNRREAGRPPARPPAAAGDRPGAAAPLHAAPPSGRPVPAPGSTCGWRRPPRPAPGAAATAAASRRVSGLGDSRGSSRGRRRAGSVRPISAACVRNRVQSAQPAVQAPPLVPVGDAGVA